MCEEITDALNKATKNEHVTDSPESSRASGHKAIGIRHGKDTEGI